MTKIKITTTVVLVREFDVSTYGGMTPKQAAEYERLATKSERISSFIEGVDSTPSDLVNLVEVVEIVE